MQFVNRVKEMNSNSLIVLKNVFGAFSIKGMSLILSFFTVPAFIRYFSDNVYLGIWYTLVSVLMWFMTFDFGIGNGIRNSLTKAFANHDDSEAKKIISSGLLSVTLIGILLTVIGVFFFRIVDLSYLFNVPKNEISETVLFHATSLVFVAIMLRFVLGVVTSIFYALQKSSVNNLLAFISALLTFIFVVCFHYESPSDALKALSIIYIFTYNCPIIIAAFLIFRKELRKCRPSINAINWATIKHVQYIGGIFFFCQILYALIMNTNQFLITKFYGPEFTVDYMFYYKVTSLIGTLVMLAMTPVWSVVTKAYEEKDYAWLRLLYKRLKILSFVIFALEFLMIPLLQPIMNLWLGQHSIKIDYGIALSFVCFDSWFVLSGILSTFVCGIARMKLQLIYYSIGVLLKLGLIIAISKYWANWSLVVWTNVLIFALYSIAQMIDLNRYLKTLKV